MIGLTFVDDSGTFPATCTWQFNFTFNLRLLFLKKKLEKKKTIDKSILLILNMIHSEDMYAQDSIDLLKNSGIDFNKFGTINLSLVSLTFYEKSKNIPNSLHF
jgi:hypothetical protein